MNIIPPLYKCTRIFDQTGIKNIKDETKRQLNALNLEPKELTGKTIALGIASRGTHDLKEIVLETLIFLKEKGMKPFIFPAMGSHGGGTSQGQAQVLDKLGISEQITGVPIRSAMDVKKIGTIPDGADIFFSSTALEADYVAVINRIKPHTIFKSDVESGLCKILAVGCGKREGASEMHRYDLATTIQPAAELIIQKIPLLFGVAVTETAAGETHNMKAILPEEFIKTDRNFLKQAKKLLPTLAATSLDILIVDEMGKNISGPGMDTNVIGFWRRDGGERVPDIRYLAVLDLTKETQGNATGIGMADFITEKVHKKIDWEATYLNALTAGYPRNGSCPIIMKNDSALIEKMISLLPSNRSPRIMRIKNTQDLTQFYISSVLRAEVELIEGVSINGTPEHWKFSPEGYILS